MKNWILKNWYLISVFIAGIFALILTLGNWNFTQKMLICSMIFIQLHFFEEFGFPGGFPWIAMKVEMKMAESDPKKWPLNNVSACWGNQWFAVFVYLLPLLLPQVRFLTLAAVIFAFAELLMHLGFFNITLKTWYNPGLFTAVFGLVPLSIAYFIRIPVTSVYSWLDLIVAVVWIGFNYWVAFRSPIYQSLGRKSEYAFSDEEVNLAAKYMK